MAKFKTKVKLYCEANGKVYADERLDENIILQDDGSGPYVETWTVSGVNKPTVEQLNALESDATNEDNNNVIRQTRKNAYGNIGDQLDEIFKDIDAWKARIQAIKDANAKE